jgi:hypothetical protein
MSFLRSYQKNYPHPVEPYGHFRVGKNSSPDPILSQMNSVRIATPYFFKSHFNIILYTYAIMWEMLSKS